MLEASQHKHNSFLTLTYDDEHLPDDFTDEKTGLVYAPNSVDPYHHKLFIDRFRTDFKRKTGKTIRYFMCAEYGEKTQRPHYHYALFGYPSCSNPVKLRKGEKPKPCNCPNCSFVRKHWIKGHIYLGNLTQHSAQYVAGYVTKKLTSIGHDYKDILHGRYPEFGRQSKMPGLGLEAVLKHAEKIKPHIKTQIVTGKRP